MLFLGLFIIAVSFLMLCFNTPKTMLFIVVLIALFAMDKAYPAEAEKSDMIGLGGVNCAEFAKDFRRNPAIDNWYYIWSTGFMTGMNAALSITGKEELKRNLSTKSMETVKKEVRQYCNEHPLSDYANGVLKVMTEMPAYDVKEDSSSSVIKFK